jgi:hypothetical protein
MAQIELPAAFMTAIWSLSSTEVNPHGIGEPPLKRMPRK